jgi:hypothetical protein
MAEDPSPPKVRARVSARLPAQALNYHNPNVARQVARRERKLRIARVINIIGNALTILLIVSFFVFWRFKTIFLRMLLRHH